MKNSFVIAVFALLVGACAGTSTVPEWIDGSSTSYPANRYLMGMGQADSAALARDRARADLAKVFEVKITEDSRDHSSATFGSGASEATFESRTERNLAVQSDHMLEGVQVVEVWRDPQGTHHALAVLDRFRLGDTLRKDIEALDGVTDREIARARNEGDLLLRIAAASKAASAQQERSQFQAYLRVVDVTGVGIPARHDVRRLEADYATLAGRLGLRAEAEVDPTGRLPSLLAGAVAKAGFTNGGDYRLVGNLQINEMVEDGWYWARGTLALSLIDSSGNMRGAWQWPVKASARQANVARQRVATEVESVLRDRLRKAILGTE